jgi:hypothetical protein
MARVPVVPWYDNTILAISTTQTVTAVEFVELLNFTHTKYHNSRPHALHDFKKNNAALPTPFDPS